MSDKTKKLKLTHNECITMLEASLSGPGLNLAGVDWSCFLALISCDNKLVQCNKAIEAAQDPKNIGEGKPAKQQQKLKKDWDEFVKEREVLQKKHAKKDQSGEPMVTREGRVISEDPALLAAEFEPLKAKYQDAIDAREEQLKRVNEKLEEEVTVELPVITKKQLPAEITQAALAPFAKLLVAQ